MKKAFVVCGVLSSLWYMAMNAVVPAGFPGYDFGSQTVSEISALGAPTRPVWVAFAFGYVLLFAAFGWGVWKSVGGDRRLRVVGMLILVYSLFNAYWPPMHLRGEVPTLTDTLHITWTIVTVIMMMLMMGFAAAALGSGFRIYTIVSILLLILFGSLTSIQAGNIPRNLPTPWMGLWERINIGVFMVWVVVLATRMGEYQKKAALQPSAS